jgi:hypothetical protein
MGRTNYKYRDDEEDRRKNKSAKHSKNIPGKGMRVINNWSEEYDDDLDLEEELSDYDEDEYYANTTLTQRNKGNTNGY